MVDVCPAGTVTEVGATSVALVFHIVTGVPPTGAALVRVTVQALLPFGPRLVGLQTSDDSVTGATRLKVTLCGTLFNVAVTVALWSVGIVPVVALNVAEVKPPGTDTEVGVVSRALSPDSETVVPPVGAA